MTITWYGQSCFKIVNQGGHFTIITDPFDKSIGLTPPRGVAEIITVSHQHPDHNYIQSISNQPFVIDSPGEYEIKGVSIYGLNSFHDQQKGQSQGLNTIYLIEMDKIKVCHLGDLGQDQLSDHQLEILGQVDILMIPVGGLETIDGARAVSIVEQIEPSLVIPMHYKIDNLQMKLDNVDKFLKAMGIADLKPIDKITLKKKDLLGKEMEVVLLQL